MQRWPNKVDLRAEWRLQGIQSEKVASGRCSPISTNHVALFGLSCTGLGLVSTLHLALAIFQQGAPCFGHCPLFFFKQKTAYEIASCLVGSEMCIRDSYYPPYHSKYNPIERCWSSLHQKWNGVLLKCWDVVQACALRMTWKQQHPNVFKNDNDYPTGVIVPKQEMMQLNKRLQRSDSLRKYDILITPKTPRGR